MPDRSSRRTPLMLSVALGALCVAASPAAFAAPSVGSSQPAPIEPDQSRPDSTPCRVQLFKGAAFGATAQDFSYTPPASCPGPWAKVVLETDIAVQAGRQFDRTATIFLGGVNLLFGTTAEPRAALAPSWHVERDVTDDTALFRAPQQGNVLIANYQTSVYTSGITADAALLFYPATRKFPAPRTPDLVIPLQADPTAGTTGLANASQSLSRTVTLPRNVESARLDVLLQSQSNDEFWYTCVPDALATALQTCGGGPFREGQVAIDGRPAGTAPVYPWIYTGGIDPYLWEPIPGVQTLAFDPFRVELSPFAGALDDGRPHTVSLSVAGADNSFSVTGTLYLTLDHGSSRVQGALIRDTLGSPAPQSSNTIVQNDGTATGTVTTRSTHGYELDGYVLTSHGPVFTAVKQRSRFSSVQDFDVSSTLDDQAVKQRTETDTSVTRVGLGGLSTETRTASYPLDLHFRYVVAADGSATQATTVDQGLSIDGLATRNGIPVDAYRLRERVTPNDTLDLNASGALTAHTGGGTASYLSADTGSGCVTRREASENSVLIARRVGTECDLSGLAP